MDRSLHYRGAGAAGLLDQPREQRVRLLAQVLRMPLDAQRPWAGLQRLADAVGRGRDDPHAGAGRRDGLVVEAVDQHVAPEPRGERLAGGEPQPVDAGVEGIGELAVGFAAVERQVPDQRAAEDDVEQLVAAADAQQGQLVRRARRRSARSRARRGPGPAASRPSPARRRSGAGRRPRHRRRRDSRAGRRAPLGRLRAAAARADRRRRRWRWRRARGGCPPTRSAAAPACP